jgi:hypothetical protein
MTDTQLLNAEALLPIKIDDRNGNTPMEVQVRVTGVRHVFGRTDVQVTPLFGNGSAWVRLTSLREFIYATSIEKEAV